MANHKSAAKRARISERRRVRNRSKMSAVRTALRQFREAVAKTADGTTPEASVAELMRNTQSVLARAASKGLIHKRNADRRIARIAAAFKKLGSKGTSSGATAATPGKGKKPSRSPASAKPKAAAASKSKGATAASKALPAKPKSK